MFIYLLGAANGTITAKIHNPAVESTLLQQIYLWIEAGATLDDVIERLRLQTVPPGNTIHNWTEGIGCYITLLAYTFYRKRRNQIGKIAIYFGSTGV